MVKYIDNVNARAHLRFMEWQAVLRLTYHRDYTDMAQAFPEYMEVCDQWHAQYKTYIKRNPKRPRAVALNSIYLSLLNNKIENLEEFYLRLSTEVTNLRTSKSRVKKAVLDEENYVTEFSFDTKIVSFQNNNRIVNLVLKEAVEFVHTGYTKSELNSAFNDLVLEYVEALINKKELVALRDLFLKKVYAMEKSITRAEALILRTPDKKLAKDAYHLYGLFKLRCEVGDAWTLSQTELAREKLGVGKPAALKAVDLLIKLKLIEIFEQVTFVNAEAQATVYKRIG